MAKFNFSDADENYGWDWSEIYDPPMKWCLDLMVRDYTPLALMPVADGSGPADYIRSLLRMSRLYPPYAPEGIALWARRLMCVLHWFAHRLANSNAHEESADVDRLRQALAAAQRERDYAKREHHAMRRERDEAVNAYAGSQAALTDMVAVIADQSQQIESFKREVADTDYWEGHSRYVNARARTHFHCLVEPNHTKHITST